MTTAFSALNSNNMDAFGSGSSEQQQPQPVAAAGQQPVYIVVQSGATTTTRTADKEHFAKNYPLKPVRWMSIVQIALFVFLVLTQVIVLSIEHRGTSEVSAGIWCGIFFGFAGALGIISTAKTTSCSIIFFLVLNIVACVFTIPLFWTNVAGISMIKSNRRWRDDFNETTATIATLCYASQILVAVLECVISVVLAALCCRVTCCRQEKTTGTVVYTPPGGPDGQQQPAQAIHVPLNTATQAGGAGTAITIPMQGQKNTASFPPGFDEEEESPMGAGEKYQRFQ